MSIKRFALFWGSLMILQRLLWKVSSLPGNPTIPPEDQGLRTVRDVFMRTGGLLPAEVYTEFQAGVSLQQSGDYTAAMARYTRVSQIAAGQLEVAASVRHNVNLMPKLRE